MSYDDLIQQLDESRHEYAPKWMPEPGDVLAGTIVERSEVHGQHSTYTAYTVEQEDGQQFAIHATRKVLQEDLVGAAPGERIAVRYNGLRKSKGEHSYYSYDVARGPVMQAALENGNASARDSTPAETEFGAAF